MRWCLFIPNISILLTLDLGQGCGCGAAGVKDASHLVCFLEDDDAELKQGLATAGLPMPLTEAETWKINTGIRRHRWLCQERC